MAIPKDEYAIWKPAIDDLLKQTTFPHKSLKSLNSAFAVTAVNGTLKWVGNKKGSLFKVTIVSEDQPRGSDLYRAGDKALLSIAVEEWLTDPARQETCGVEPCTKMATRSTIGHSARCFCSKWIPYNPERDTLVPCCQWLVWWLADDLPMSTAEKDLMREHERRRAGLDARENVSTSSGNQTGGGGNNEGGAAAGGPTATEIRLQAEVDYLRASIATRERDFDIMKGERDDLRESQTTHDQEMDIITKEMDDLSASLAAKARELGNAA